MSNKSKGINAEREIIQLFADTGMWYACRVAGSGSSRFPSPDIIAGNKLRKLAIECKTCIEKKKYLSKEVIEQLMEFSDIFGAEPWIAIKYRGLDWYFISPGDIRKINKNFILDSDTARNRGLLFEELIKK